MAPVAAAPAKGAPPAPIPAAESASLEDKNWFFDKVLFCTSWKTQLYAERRSKFVDTCISRICTHIQAVVNSD